MTARIDSSSVHTEGTPLLMVRNLSVGFERAAADSLAVRDLSLTIHRGECLALVGESGSGKTVSALSVVRLLPNQARIRTGQALFNGEDLFSLAEREMRAIRGGRIGLIFQDPMMALNPVMPVGKQVGEVLALHKGLKGKAAQERIRDLFDQVGLPGTREISDLYPHELSGGMRQRVMVAQALAGDPELLIADEPTTALDLVVQAQVVELLNRLRRERSMALWLISHDLGMVDQLADRVAVMKAGALVEEGSTTHLKNPHHPYTRSLLEALPRLDDCLSRDPECVKAAPPILSVSNLTVRYGERRWRFGARPRKKSTLQAVSLDLFEGETLALVGASGCGKTTLARALVGLVTPESGQITLNADALGQGGTSFARARAIQMVFQDPHGAMNPKMEIRGILSEGLLALCPALDARAREDRIRSMLKAVGLAEIALDAYPHEFSGGQRQRLAIARALLVEPRILILDEPTSALDVSIQAQVLALLASLKAEMKLTYLFISHDLGVVSRLADRVAVMERGHIVELGPVRQVLMAPEAEATQKLVSALPPLRRQRRFCD